MIVPTHSDAAKPTAPAITDTKVALVTGAGRRLGRAIALGLAAAGYDVAVHYGTSREPAEQVVADIQGLGRRALAIGADLADPIACGQLFDQTESFFGRLDCIVNSAARFEFDDPAGFSADSLQRHLGPNLTAPILLSQRLHASCKQVGRTGVVINLLDQKLDNLNPDFFSYTLTKASLHAATRMMAMAFAPHLRVNGVSPGATLTSWKQNDEQFALAHRIALLGRSSQPDDIVQAVVYLAAAGAVTGVNLIVDGGQHLMPLDRDVMFLTPNAPSNPNTPNDSKAPPP